LKAKHFDFTAVKPNRKDNEDKITPEGLIAIIESQAQEIANAIAKLKNFNS